MASEGHQATLTLPLRWLVIPAALWSAVAAVLVIVKRRTSEPSLTPMSTEWLNSHANDRPDWDR